MAGAKGRRNEDGIGNGRAAVPGRLRGSAPRYLITGSAGFIGSHLAEALLGRGAAVVGVDAFTDTYAGSAKRRNVARCVGHDRFTLVEADLAAAPLDRLLDGVDGVFHLAGRPGVRTSWGTTFSAYVHDNLIATQRLFEAATHSGVRVVYASSSSVYGATDAYPLREDAVLNPVSPYGVTKLACERLASAYGHSRGLDAVGLRYFSVYGPRQRPDMAFARIVCCLQEERPFPVLGTGRQTRDFTYVDDVVSATQAAMDRAPAGRVYNVGGGSEISVLDALALCEEIARRTITLHHGPSAPGDARRTLADGQRIRDELGWAPATALEDGLRAQIRSGGVDDAVPSIAW